MILRWSDQALFDLDWMGRGDGSPVPPNQTVGHGNGSPADFCDRREQSSCHMEKPMRTVPVDLSLLTLWRLAGLFHGIQDCQKAFPQGSKILIDCIPHDSHSNAFIVMYNAIS